mmetsp:Transcript_20446/g.40891  ORF Transcript_20446/g.40891 Transcript_20446/m.40891 type:complete len:397 (+) Transcript_20446:872-2062(+)
MRSLIFGPQVLSFMNLFIFPGIAHSCKTLCISGSMRIEASSWLPMILSTSAWEAESSHPTSPLASLSFCLFKACSAKGPMSGPIGCCCCSAFLFFFSSLSFFAPSSLKCSPMTPANSVIKSSISLFPLYFFCAASGSRFMSSMACMKRGFARPTARRGFLDIFSMREAVAHSLELSPEMTPGAFMLSCTSSKTREDLAGPLGLVIVGIISPSGESSKTSSTSSSFFSSTFLGLGAAFAPPFFFFDFFGLSKNPPLSPPPNFLAFFLSSAAFFSSASFLAMAASAIICSMRVGPSSSSFATAGAGDLSAESSSFIFRPSPRMGGGASESLSEPESDPESSITTIFFLEPADDEDVEEVDLSTPPTPLSMLATFDGCELVGTSRKFDIEALRQPSRSV